MLAHGAQQRYQACTATLLAGRVSVNCQDDAVQFGQSAGGCRAGVRQIIQGEWQKCRLSQQVCSCHVTSSKLQPNAAAFKDCLHMLNVAEPSGAHSYCGEPTKRDPGMVAVACTLARLRLPVCSRRESMAAFSPTGRAAVTVTQVSPG